MCVWVCVWTCRKGGGDFDLSKLPAAAAERGVGDSLPASVVMGLLAALGGPLETETPPPPLCWEEMGDLRARSCSSASFWKKEERIFNFLNFFSTKKHGTEPYLSAKLLLVSNKKIR
jgi:hypothetical protein